MALNKLADPASKALVAGGRQIKPVISADVDEARFRVKRVYKEWQRYAPEMRHSYVMPQNMTEVRLAIKRQFAANADVNDPRAIDLLVHKAAVELTNTRARLNLSAHVMWTLFPEMHKPQKPKNFLSKFLSGKF